MVALPRLLEPMQVRVEILLAVEGSAVDPRQLRVPLVAAPVGACEAGQLERLDRLRVLQVRAAAEIGEVALRVEGDRALGGVDQLDLVGLMLLVEVALCLLGAHLLAVPGAALGELLADLLLDLLECVLADRLRELEVVVETVLDRRADRDLGARVETPDGLGEQVRGRVAQDVERVGILRVAGRQDLDLLAVLEWRAQVLDEPVRAHEDGLLGQLRPDRARRVETGGAVGKFELRRIGQYDLHGRSGYFDAPRGRPQRRTGRVACTRPGRGRRRAGRPTGGLAATRPPRRPSARPGT